MKTTRFGLSGSMKTLLNDDGFTFVETLLAVAISLVVSVAVCLAYSAFWGNSKNLFKGCYKANALAKSDMAIRRRIREFVVPYWSNGEMEFAEFRDSLMECGVEGATILSCSLKIYGDGWAGVRCLYTLPGIDETLCVEERVGGFPVLEERR